MCEKWQLTVAGVVIAILEIQLKFYFWATLNSQVPLSVTFLVFSVPQVIDSPTCKYFYYYYYYYFLNR